MSAVAQNLQRLYDGGNGPLTKDGLKKAVVKTWITPDDYKTITGDDYTE